MSFVLYVRVEKSRNFILMETIKVRYAKQGKVCQDGFFGKARWEVEVKDRFWFG